MNDISLKDLNTLRVLVEEVNVTEAATRLGVSQSTVSRTLARLRLIFGDDLLFRTGRGMATTERARGLGERITALLSELGAAVSQSVDFDADTSTRVFTISGCDLALAVILPELLSRVCTLAPGIRIEASPHDWDSARELDGRADLLLDSPVMHERPGVKAQRLFVVSRWLVAVHESAAPAVWNSVEWSRLPQVVVAARGNRRRWVDALMETPGVPPVIRCSVPNFLEAWHVVRRTRLAALLPDILFSLVPHDDLVLLNPPVDLPEVAFSQLWSVRLDRDPGHRWLRSQIAQVARSLSTGPPAPCVLAEDFPNQ